MKKLFLAVALVMVMCSGVYAADSTVTETMTWRGNDMFIISLDWIAATDGTFTSYVLKSPTPGCLFYVITNPGSPAPTDNYDITVLNSDGIDMAGGQLVDRDTANSEDVKLATVRCSYDTVTVTISNNSEALAAGTIRLFFGR
jgi:hypothetical protein